ncbi:MAG: tetratricopeptide repeat protein, partial [Leptolyngbya sp.]|nr:tetratricopeptide repeat protein [Candidatus Melainabacteria bacterium]
DLDAAIKQNPTSIRSWQYRCSIFVNRGQDKEAVECLSRLIALSPDNSINYHVRANYYVKDKEYAKAAADLTHAVNLQPGEFEPLIIRGDIYRKMKQYPRAISDYSKAIQLNRFRAGKAFAGRAECYRALGNNQAAEMDLKQGKIGEKVYR